MNPLHDLWLECLASEMEALGAKPYSLGKLWSRPKESGHLLKLGDGVMKIEVMEPEKVQKAKLPVYDMRIFLHFPASRRLRPIMLDYGTPKTKEDVLEAVQALLKVVREHL